MRFVGDSRSLQYSNTIGHHPESQGAAIDKGGSIHSFEQFLANNNNSNSDAVFKLFPQSEDGSSSFGGTEILKVKAHKESEESTINIQNAADNNLENY